MIYLVYACCIVISFIIISILWKGLVVFIGKTYKSIVFIVRFFKWRFSSSKYAGRYCLYNRQRRKIVSESYYNVKLKGINGKEGNKKTGYHQVPKSQIILIN